MQASRVGNNLAASVNKSGRNGVNEEGVTFIKLRAEEGAWALQLWARELYQARVSKNSRCRKRCLQRSYHVFRQELVIGCGYRVMCVW